VIEHSETHPKNRVKEMAAVFGFETDLDFLDYAARRQGVNDQTKAAQIESYVLGKEMGKPHEPFFVIHFIADAERLKCGRTVQEEVDKPPRLSTRTKRQQERRKFSVSRRH
jgi:hypothetical protein